MFSLCRCTTIYLYSGKPKTEKFIDCLARPTSHLFYGKRVKFLEKKGVIINFEERNYHLNKSKKVKYIALFIASLPVLGFALLYKYFSSENKLKETLLSSLQEGLKRKISHTATPGPSLVKKVEHLVQRQAELKNFKMESKLDMDFEPSSPQKIKSPLTTRSESIPELIGENTSPARRPLEVVIHSIEEIEQQGKANSDYSLEAKSRCFLDRFPPVLETQQVEVIVQSSTNLIEISTNPLPDTEPSLYFFRPSSFLSPENPPKDVETGLCSQ